MKIALLTLAGPWGGTEIHAVQLARTLQNRGHEAIVVCMNKQTFDDYSARSFGNINLIYCPIPKAITAMSIAGWMRYFAKQKWDVVVLVKGSFRLGNWRLDLAARLVFENYVTIEHLMGDPISEKTSRRYFGFLPGLGLWWYRERISFYLRSLSPRIVVCVSNAVGRRLVNDYRFSRRKVVTVHNGIDVQRFRRDDASGQEWRRRWNIPDSAFVFGAVGRLATMKGYDNALKSFQLAVDRCPDRDMRLVFVGEGPQEQCLKSLAERVVPQGRIVFSPFCDRPWEALSAFDVFIMPSKNEGLPLALVEAMACECCPIATAIAGIPEVLQQPNLGWLVPGGDVKAFADAMVDAVSRPTHDRIRMAACARDAVVKNFNAFIQFNVLADLIEMVPSANALDGARLKRFWIDQRKAWYAQVVTNRDAQRIPLGIKPDVETVC